MADNTVTTLDGLRSGRFVVTTIHGTTHTIDLDKKTLVRKAADPNRTWDYAGVGLGAVTPDGEPFYFDTLKDATVGSRMLLENSEEWRMTSVVVSVEPVDV